MSLRNLFLCSATAALASLIPARAEGIICEGILGNSGEQGQSLVRFGNVSGSLKGAIGGGTASGMGVACDRMGSLWDRGGAGTLNRYAPDGRLLAQYKIPSGIDRSDQLALARDFLLMQIQGKLYSLPITAPAGTEAKALERDSACISFNSSNGAIASFSKGKIFWIKPDTGDATESVSMANVQGLEVGADGALYAVTDGKVFKYVDGRPVSEGWPKAVPGERMQFLDGHFFGHAWHGTIRRFDADLEPDPGVVLGGASGSFIGHLDQNSELSNGRGMAFLRTNLYAVSGFGGTLQLLQWLPEKRQMQIVRRIGAVPFCSGLGLDRNGRVWWHFGAWNWSDKPDTPIVQGINSPEELGQAVMLENDNMVAPAWMWGKPAFYSGPLKDEIKTDRIESGCALMHGLAASAVYKNKDKQILLVIDKSGKGVSFNISPEGKYQSEAGPVLLKTATPVKEWTTLAFKEQGQSGPGTLLGAADGAVIEFSADGNDWKETRRWSEWETNAAGRFGGKIYISLDAGSLWVSDSDRQRVLVFNAGAAGKPIASFGTDDKAGSDSGSICNPQMIAARGGRAVVHDAGNQRLVELRLKAIAK